MTDRELHSVHHRHHKVSRRARIERTIALILTWYRVPGITE